MLFPGQPWHGRAGGSLLSQGGTGPGSNSSGGELAVLGAEAQAGRVRQAGTSLPTPPPPPLFSPDATVEPVPGAWGHLETLMDSSEGPCRRQSPAFRQGLGSLLEAPTLPCMPTVGSAHLQSPTDPRPRGRQGCTCCKGQGFWWLGQGGHESCSAWPWQAPGSPARIHPHQAAPGFPKIGWRSLTWKRPQELSVLQALLCQGSAGCATGAGMMGVTGVGDGSRCPLGTITGETALPPLPLHARV